VIIAGSQETLALCALYSPADEQLHRGSNGALNVFDYRGEEDLIVVWATTILSVVAMVPFVPPTAPSIQGDPTRFFLVEKFALGVVDTGTISE